MPDTRTVEHRTLVRAINALIAAAKVVDTVPGSGETLKKIDGALALLSEALKKE
jgi:hypothetical protein